uniref:Uncharacterized protein n=1 Tax=Nelumbo nucifera TaxID=4432 RepID=A0A822Z2L8_NELNU|nr:TPA_asm: hypothetical protein HUJ06_006378 [Nelumbo nucifera]
MPIVACFSPWCACGKPKRDRACRKTRESAPAGKRERERECACGKTKERKTRKRVCGPTGKPEKDWEITSNKSIISVENDPNVGRSGVSKIREVKVFCVCNQSVTKPPFPRLYAQCSEKSSFFFMKGPCSVFSCFSSTATLNNLY